MEVKDLLWRCSHILKRKKSVLVPSRYLIKNLTADTPHTHNHKCTSYLSSCLCDENIAGAYWHKPFLPKEYVWVVHMWGGKEVGFRQMLLHIKNVNACFITCYVMTNRTAHTTHKPS